MDGSGVVPLRVSTADDATTPLTTTPLATTLDSDAQKKSTVFGAVTYPGNVTIGNMYYFFAAPTLCYELNFPRYGLVVRGGSEGGYGLVVRGGSEWGNGLVVKRG